MIQTATAQAIMEVVVRSPGCYLEDIVHECAGLTWNQVFLEIDRLSREGDVLLNVQRPGCYRVTPGVTHS